VNTLVRRSILHVVQRGWVASLAGGWRRFFYAARQPEAAQLRRLKSILSLNADSRFGKARDFAGIDSVASYQRRVPLVTYDDLSEWMHPVVRGEENVLTSEKVNFLERTSGSTSQKLIPYTAGLLSEFSAATNPWLYDLHRHHPELFGTQSYWSISPVVRDLTPTAKLGCPWGLSLMRSISVLSGDSCLG
jgi:hypothetical protein